MGGLLWSRFTVLNALIALAIAAAAAGYWVSSLAYWPLVVLLPLVLVLRGEPGPSGLAQMAGSRLSASLRPG